MLKYYFIESYFKQTKEYIIF